MIHSGILAPIHRYVHGKLQFVRNQLLITKPSGRVTDDPPAPSVKLYSFTHKAELLRCVVGRETAITSTLNTTVYLVRENRSIFVTNRTHSHFRVILYLFTIFTRILNTTLRQCITWFTITDCYIANREMWI